MEQQEDSSSWTTVPPPPLPPPPPPPPPPPVISSNNGIDVDGIATAVDPNSTIIDYNNLNTIAATDALAVVNNEVMIQQAQEQEQQQAQQSLSLLSVCKQLEMARCYETELEAWISFGSNQLKYWNMMKGSSSSSNRHHNNKNDIDEIRIQYDDHMMSSNENSHENNQQHIPAGVIDAWKALGSSIPRNDDDQDITSTMDNTSANNDRNNNNNTLVIPISGSVSKAIMMNCIVRSIQQISYCSNHIITERQRCCAIQNNNKRLRDDESSLSFKDSIQFIQDYKNNNINTYSTIWMNILYDQLRTIRYYHAQHHNTATEMMIMNHNNESLTSSNKRNKLSYHNQQASSSSSSSSSRQQADGYNIASTVRQWTEDLLLYQNNQQNNDNTPTSSNNMNSNNNSLSVVGSGENNNNDSLLSVPTSNNHNNNIAYRTEEIFGKYIDLKPQYEYMIQNCHELIVQSLVSSKQKKMTTTTTTTTSTNIIKHEDEDNDDDSDDDMIDDEQMNQQYQYIDFIEDLLYNDAINGNIWNEQLKLTNRKVYIRLIIYIYDYLISYIQRTIPLLNIYETIIKPTIQQFHNIWYQTGGYENVGWSCKVSEKSFITSSMLQQDNNNSNNINNTNEASSTTLIKMEHDTNHDSNDNNNNSVKIDDNSNNMKPLIDLSIYDTPQELLQHVNAEQLKSELIRLQLKCGGTPYQRAERYFLLKRISYDQLPSKVFVNNNKKKNNNNNNNNKSNGSSNNNVITSSSPMTTTTTSATTMISTKNERRIDIARRDVIVLALLDQVRPILEATHRRLIRRQTQTLSEREREIEEDLYGVMNNNANHKKKKKLKKGKNMYMNDNDENNDDDNDNNDSDTDTDSDDEPIYNPKNVPLDFDGKPIPYWLFKLHGLQHYYKCEICNNEVYRGRRNYELHFAEAKHTLGMKSLNIPNTKHFHGIATILDVQKLWLSLQKQMDNSSSSTCISIGGSGGTTMNRDEEYEDSHGNVLSRMEYEDLARQGLL